MGSNNEVFVKGFRFFNSLDLKHVDLGSYKDMVNDIRESGVVSLKVKDCPDVDITFYTPSYEYDSLPVIIFIHGGGWVGGNSKKIASFTKLLASNGYVVVSVDYALAPEYPYPVSTIQLIEVLNHIYNNASKYKINKDKIFIGGTSAGAHLSSQLGCLVTNKEYALKLGVKLDVSKILGLILINGVYNFDTVGDSHFPGIKRFLWAYTGKKNYLEYVRINELSTIKYITKSYPSVFVTAGDKDPLRGQSYELVEVLKENKINYVDVFGIKLNHDFIYELDNSDSQKTYEEIVKFLNDNSK